MTQQTVTRLKELLFDKESRDLAELARRIEALGAGERQERAELTRRVEDLAKRAGGEAEFQASVTRVLEGSLRDGERDQHRELTQAMAPMVRRTFRKEIESEQVRDEIANALYTRMGAMISRYIANAMRDMMDTINRRLESSLTQNRLILKLRSLTSGRSMAELALADTQVFKVEELYLIRRGSGELVHRWSRETAAEPSPTRPGSNRDTLVSGFLTAITSFAEEAFASDKSSLRALDLDEYRIYLRASPAYLLAARCSGSAEGAVEQVLEDELLALLTAHRSIEATAAAPGTAGTDDASPERTRRRNDQLLQDAALRIEERIADSAREIRRRRGSRPFKILATLLVLGFAGWAAWNAYITHITAELQRRADDVVQSVPELAGYPVRARVERGGRTIWVSGLTPSVSAREQLMRGIKAFAPDVQIGETLGILPQTDVKSAVDAAAEQRSLARAQRRLEKLGPDLERVAQGLGAGPNREAVESARSAASAAAGEVGRPAAGESPARLIATLHDTIGKLRAAADRLVKVAGLQVDASADATTGALPPTVTESAEELSLAAERIGALAQAIEQARLIAPVESRNVELARRLEELTRRVDGLKTAPTPRERLETFIKSNAVFFSNNIDYRDPATATKVLDELVAHVGRVPGLIRVVGYTDEAGAGPRNQSLSQQRADKVAEELVARGVPRARLVAVGRAAALDLAPRTGATSASRRVEFEIGFAGEDPGSP